MLQKKTSGGVPADRDVETGQAVHVVSRSRGHLHMLVERCGLVDQAEIPPKSYRRITICKNSVDFPPA